mmetsp:Transcript_20522/g.23551  ORF Transcript_20522/g.23551 Transcript_20522/m.23551 type:complete len:229 (+) Transcript_20522:869-1555(+)
MSSPSHFTHRSDSLSLKKSFPSCLAKVGICWMIASRILHLPSSAKSMIAGKSDWDNRSTPITEFKADSDDIRFNRTSDDASLRRRSNGGNKKEMVESFPSIGASSVATIASAALTCSLSSSVSAATCLTNLSATRTLALGSSPLLASSASAMVTLAVHFATSDKLNVAAVRTSASGSWSNFSKASTRDSTAPSHPTNAPTASENLDATVQRTLQERSSIVATSNGNIL